VSVTNHCVFIGYMTADPELKYTASGKAVLNFSLGVNSIYNREKTAFPRFTVWDKQAENLASFVKKGHRLAVEGEYETQVKETEQGNTTYHFFNVSGWQSLTAKPDQDAASTPESSKPQSKSRAGTRPAPVDEDLDEIPF